MRLYEIASLRLHAQALTDSKTGSPAELVEWMLAMQGQDYPGARWSVGLRSPGNTEAEVEASIAEKAIVRSWLMRGTLHLVSAKDILWLLRLVGPRVIAGNQRRYRELELDEATLRRSNELILEALEKEAALSRRELLEHLRKNGLSTEGQRGVYMLQRASLDRLICQGHVHANNPSFMSLDGFPEQPFSQEEALAELARRYFASRAPATIQDFIWWSGLPAAEARAGLDSIRDSLNSESIDAQTYWWPQSLHAMVQKAHTTFLLPAFDEYLIAYKDRIVALGMRSFSQLAPTGGMIPGTVVLDGKVKGTWKRTLKKEVVVISIFPYEALSKQEENRITAAAGEFGRFLGRNPIME